MRQFDRDPSVLPPARQEVQNSSYMLPQTCSVPHHRSMHLNPLAGAACSPLAVASAAARAAAVDEAEEAT